MENERKHEWPEIVSTILGLGICLVVVIIIWNYCPVWNRVSMEIEYVQFRLKADALFQEGFTTFDHKLQYYREPLENPMKREKHTNGVPLFKELKTTSKNYRTFQYKEFIVVVKSSQAQYISQKRRERVVKLCGIQQEAIRTAFRKQLCRIRVKKGKKEMKVKVFMPWNKCSPFDLDKVFKHRNQKAIRREDEASWLELLQAEKK